MGIDVIVAQTKELLDRMEKAAPPGTTPGHMGGYNPNRSESGQWASGGGVAGEPERPEGISDAWQQALSPLDATTVEDDATTMKEFTGGQNLDSRSIQTKQRKLNIKNLSERLRGDADVEALAKDWNEKAKGYETGSIEALIGKMHTRWGAEAAGASQRGAVFQLAVRDEFGLAPGLDPFLQCGKEAERLGALADYDKHGAAMRKIVRATYDETQSWFSSRGITHVRLWRGMVFSGELPKALRQTGLADVASLPASSFSIREREALRFARVLSPGGRPMLFPGETSVLLEAVVPVGRVLSSARTGFGWLGGAETVMLGGQSRLKVRVIPRQA